MPRHFSGATAHNPALRVAKTLGHRQQGGCALGNQADWLLGITALSAGSGHKRQVAFGVGFRVAVLVGVRIGVRDGVRVALLVGVGDAVRAGVELAWGCRRVYA